MDDKKPLLAGFVMGVIITYLIGTLAGMFFYKDSVATETKKPVKEVSFDPKQTTCFLFDLGPAGWFQVTEKNRLYISEQVGKGKYDWMEAETLTCYKRYPDKTIGEPMRIRMEWYRKRRYQ